MREIGPFLETMFILWKGELIGCYEKYVSSMPYKPHNRSGDQNGFR